MQRSELRASEVRTLEVRDQMSEGRGPGFANRRRQGYGGSRSYGGQADDGRQRSEFRASEVRTSEVRDQPFRAIDKRVGFG